MRRYRSLTAVLSTVATVAIGGVLAAAPAHAAVICEQYGSTPVNGYIVQNNRWGTTATQCIETTATGFRVTRADGNVPTNGAPASYPSIYWGCHYGNCTSGFAPVSLSSAAFNGISTSVAMTYPSTGTYNAAYDLWLDPTPRTTGQNTGAEIMVWLNRQGSIQPIGSRVGTVTLAGATWEVWFGNIGWNVISYVRTTTTGSLSFPVRTFTDDAIARGYAQRSWYLTSIQAGFEPWQGGVGLAVTNFSVTTGGTGGGGTTDTTAPSAPSSLRSTSVTSTSVSLAWNASTDNVGVTGYTVYRNGTQVGTPTTTSYTDSGLSPATAYQYTVRARDAAGLTSAASNTLAVTTTGTGTGGGGTGGTSSGCTATYTTTGGWSGNTQADITVRNTGTTPLRGWTVTWTFGGNQRIYNSWNALVTQTGTSVRATNASHNGAIGAGGTTTFGFQASYTGSNSAPTLTCTATI